MKMNYCSRNKIVSAIAVSRARYLLTLLTVVAFSCAIHAPLHGQVWQWAKSFGGIPGGSFNDEAMSVTASNGYIYVTGQFESPTITFGTTTLTNAGPGLTDIFLVKCDSAGNIIWAKSAGGDQSDVSNSVTTDLSGNVYIAGNFESSAITFGAFSLINEGAYNAFLVKYDSSGNVIWAKRGGSILPDSSYSESMSVVSDLSGNVYLAGFFYDPTIIFDTVTLINSGGKDIFLTKYDASGNVLWAKSAGGSGYDYATSVSTDQSGGVYITGFFQSPTIVFGTDTLTNTGSIGNAFLVKYNISGSVVWAKSASGSTSSVGYSLTAGSPGSVYVTGYFSSPTLTFDTLTLTNASGTDDVFFVKYDTTGNALWAKSSVGSGNDKAYSVTTDLSGSVYLTGGFQSPTITFDTAILMNAGTYNMFLIKYDAAGNIIWDMSAGGNSSGVATSVATDLSGSVYLTGYFSSPLLTFGSTTLSNTGWPIIFLAKYGDNGTLYTSVVNNPNSDIVLYPNPATNELTIISPQLINQITITNLVGQTVYNNYFQKEKVPVDVSGLVNGIYFVKENGIVVRTFVKN